MGSSLKSATCMQPAQIAAARVLITVSGVVQGVGFRPFVYSLAHRHNLVGFVCNNDGVVQMEVQGANGSISNFIEQLKIEAPPLSQIEHISSQQVAALHEPEITFQIRHSSCSNLAQQKFVPADTSTCQDCFSELFDKNNRRYRYPFINCTNCGPRFTIISSLPYDRQSTTMSVFPMCSLCLQEYEDPTDRRFHAQPNACSRCGPSLNFVEVGTRREIFRDENALQFAIQRLRLGEIVAVKGLGGFHLVCDATNVRAIERLRQRKSRASKPFAVMMLDMDMVRRYCHCSAAESEELCSTTRPIVLLRKQSEFSLPAEVSPELDCVGVMLPYTPLHHLLMADFNRPLIATSANQSEEPIAIDNDDALTRLEDIADGFLMHDRQIYSRYDDSVVRMVGDQRTMLRRSRGFAPLPIKLPFQTCADALACGAHLKNTFCFVHKDQAFVSQHVGDLENTETHEHFEQTLTTYEVLFGFRPDVISHDLHPDYLSTAFAQRLSAERQLPLFNVQHHHAHIASCMVEHGLTQPVIGIAFDGHGYGLDGTLWGGEFLKVSLSEFQRLAYFEPVPLPGGSQAIKNPWRMALSYICANSSPDRLGRFVDLLAQRYGQNTLDLVRKQIDKRFNSPLTSSCGRLFDAMSALLGVCYNADYEGQAAMELESLANQATGLMDCAMPDSYSFQVTGAVPPFIVRTRQVVEAAYDEHLHSVPTSVIAAKFHQTVAQIVLSVCQKARQLTGIDTVCLSGGVFQNALLLSLTCKLLSAASFSVYSPRLLPANDGGLSLGQAIIALARADAISISHQ